MLKRLGRWWFRGRPGRVERLLYALAETPVDYREVTQLADTTGLERTVYPLLTDLSRRGWVEHRWLESEDGPRLAYRLTQAGRAQLGAAHARSLEQP